MTTEAGRPQPAGGRFLVTFARTQRTVAWDGKHESLLELAEAHGLTPAFSCRSAICSTCMCGLLAGEVAYFNDPLDEPPDGMVLICSTRPASDVTIDI